MNVPQITSVGTVTDSPGVQRLYGPVRYLVRGAGQGPRALTVVSLGVAMVIETGGQGKRLGKDFTETKSGGVDGNTFWPRWLLVSIRLSGQQDAS